MPGALLQIRRALKPDGLFLAAMFAGNTLRELRVSFANAETKIRGGISPRVSPFADIRDLGGLLQRAGFALPVTDVERTIMRYRDIMRLFSDLRAIWRDQRTFGTSEDAPNSKITWIRGCGVCRALCR